MNKEIPNCKKKRTLYNLFDVFSCENCPVLIKDEEYVISENKIYIYHLYDGCILNELNEDELVNSKKMKLFLKDAIINKDKIIILWLDSFDVEKREIDLMNLASFDMDIHIMTL